MVVTRGFGAPEARICYERAEPLSHQLGRPFLLCAALVGQWRYTLLADKMSVALQIAERLHSVAQEQNDAVLMLEAYRALSCTLFYLGDFEASRQYAMRSLQIWRSGNVQCHTEDNYPPGLFVLSNAIGLAARRDRLLPGEHGGSDLHSKGAEAYESISHGARLGGGSRPMWA